MLGGEHVGLNPIGPGRLQSLNFLHPGVTDPETEGDGEQGDCYNQHDPGEVNLMNDASELNFVHSVSIS